MAAIILITIVIVTITIIAITIITITIIAAIIITKSSPNHLIVHAGYRRPHDDIPEERRKKLGWDGKKGGEGKKIIKIRIIE